MTCFNNHPSQGDSLLHCFQGTFAALFVLNYRLREFPLSVVVNRSNSKSTDAIVLQSQSLFQADMKLI